MIFLIHSTVLAFKNIFDECTLITMMKILIMIHSKVFSTYLHFQKISSTSACSLQSKRVCGGLLNNFQNHDAQWCLFCTWMQLFVCFSHLLFHVYCPFFCGARKFCLPPKAHVISSVFNSGHYWFLQVFGRRMFSVAISITETVPFFSNVYWEILLCKHRQNLLFY